MSIHYLRIGWEINDQRMLSTFAAIEQAECSFDVGFHLSTEEEAGDCRKIDRQIMYADRRTLYIDIDIYCTKVDRQSYKYTQTL